MRFLVDQDGTIANWGAEWDVHAGPLQHLGLPLTINQTSFDLTRGLNAEGKAKVAEIMDYPNFYASLKPIEGAKEALNEMLAEGHDVHIVTSPWVTNKTCASDKLDWMEKFIGPGWAKRTVITTAKTLVRGDILIDDRPDAAEHGAMVPEWEQVWFTQPYNAKLEGKRRLGDWADWRTLL